MQRNVLAVVCCLFAGVTGCLVWGRNKISTQQLHRDLIDVHRECIRVGLEHAIAQCRTMESLCVGSKPSQTQGNVQTCVVEQKDLLFAVRDSLERVEKLLEGEKPSRKILNEEIDSCKQWIESRTQL